MNKIIRENISFIIILFVSIAVAANNLPQDDTWRHLELGRLFLQIKGFPEFEPYGFLAATQPFIDYSWLSCVFYYLVYYYFSDTGLILFSIFIFSIFVYFAQKDFEKTEVKDRDFIVRNLLLIPITAAFALAIRWRITARPEMFGLVFFILFIKLLNYKIDFKKKVFLVFGLCVIWTNFHGTSSLAVFLIGLNIFGLFLEKKWKEILEYSGFLISAVLATFINPWGTRLAYESLIQGVLPINQNILEFKVLPFEEWFPYTAPVVAFFVILHFNYLIDTNKLKRKIFELFGIVFLSIKYSRCLPYIFLLTIPSVVDQLEIIFYQFKSVYLRKKIILGLASIAIFVTCFTKAINENYGFRFLQLNYMKAVDLLDSSPVKGKVFNDFATGGYLMWKGPHKYKIWIDNRSPIYVKTSFPEFLSIYDLEFCKKTLGKYPYDVILQAVPSYCDPAYSAVGGTCGFPKGCISNKDWALIFFSSDFFLYVKRKPEYDLFIKNHEFKWIDPYVFKVNEIANYLFDDFKKFPGSKVLIKEEIQRAMILNPSESRIWTILSVFEQLTSGKLPGEVK